jgi:hypothetical protein
MVTVKTRRLPDAIRRPACAAAIAVLIALAGCGGSRAAKKSREPVTLRIGFGLAASASADFGIAQAVRNMTVDQLLSIPRNGRTGRRLAEGWWHPPTA